MPLTLAEGIRSPRGPLPTHVQALTSLEVFLQSLGAKSTLNETALSSAFKVFGEIK